ncbi:MAG: hypothetical protein AAGK02_12990 [Pseudomonadota bacterium]
MSIGGIPFSLSDIEEAVKKPVERVERRADIIRDKVESMVGDVKDSLEKLENLKDSVHGFGEGLGQQVLETGESLGQGVLDLGESLGGKLPNPHDLGQLGEFRDLIDTCTAFVSGTQGTIKNVARTNFAEVEHLLKKPRGSSSGESRFLRDLGGVTEAFSGKLSDLAQSVDWIDQLKDDPELGSIAETLSEVRSSVLDHGPFGRLGKDSIPFSLPDPVINAFENIGAAGQLDQVLDRIVPADAGKKGLIDQAVEKLKPLGEKIPEFLNQKTFIQELISNPPDSLFPERKSLSAAADPNAVKIAAGVAAATAGGIKLVADATIGICDILVQSVDYLFAALNYIVSSIPFNISAGGCAGPELSVGLVSLVPACWSIIYSLAMILNWLMVLIREIVSIIANMCLSVLNIAIAVLGIWN